MAANPTAGIDFSSEESFIRTSLAPIELNKIGLGGSMSEEERTQIKNRLEMEWKNLDRIYFKAPFHLSNDRRPE